MNHQSLGILIGGLLPAILFGLVGVFQKSSTRAGIGLGLYLLCAGLGVAIAGVAVYWAVPDKTISTKSGSFAVAIGLFWGLGLALVAIAMVKYTTPLSTLVPLYNMNTLVAVLLALVVFAEWRDVNVTRLLAGAALIVVGGTLVAKA